MSTETYIGTIQNDTMLVTKVTMAVRMRFGFRLIAKKSSIGDPNSVDMFATCKVVKVKQDQCSWFVNGIAVAHVMVP